MPSSVLLRKISIRPSTIEILSTLTQTSGCGDLERVSPAAVFSTSVRPIASISMSMFMSTSRMIMVSSMKVSVFITVSIIVETQSTFMPVGTR